MKYKPVCFEEFDQVFSYDPETGEIRNKVDRGYREGIARAGDIATSKVGKGYLAVWLKNNGLYQAHRVAWLLYTGNDPGDMEIDHIDGNPENNIFSNLRVVDHQVNMMNQRKRKNNTSGITGVSWDKKAKKWRVQVGGNYIGLFDDLELAGFVAEQVREKLGYHENHGA